MNKLVDLFTGNKNTMRIQRTSKENEQITATFVKMESNIDGIQTLIGNLEHSTTLGVLPSLKVIGYYISMNNKFVIFSNSIFEVFTDDFIEGLDIMTFDELLKALYIYSKNKISEFLPYNEDYYDSLYDMKEHEIDYYLVRVAKEATYTYLKGQSFSETSNLYTFKLEEERYKTDGFMYKYLSLFVLEKYEELNNELSIYCKINKKKFINKINFNKRCNDMLIEIENTGELIERRKMLKSVNCDDYKTVNVIYEVDKLVLSTTVNNNFSYKKDHISVFDIVGKRTSTNANGIKYDDIVEITYGKKTLYKRK